MFPIREFEKRFRAILDEMDAIRDAHEDEAMDELNATFEDALFVIECIDEGEEDWREAFSDALEEFQDLCGGYRALATEIPEVEDCANRLEALARLAEANLGQPE